VITAWLDRLLRDAGVIELRHLDGADISVGTFNDIGALSSAIGPRMHSGNLYSTVNKPIDTVIATNAMQLHGTGLRDANMAVHTRLLFDFDPVRPKGVSSTMAELGAAIDARNRFVRALSAQGWPPPALAMSGNGAHTIYRLRLPVADDVDELLASLYRGLSVDFGTTDVVFDTTVRNPSRIWRVYNTINRKGNPTLDRPHRMARVTIPARWEAVSPRLVLALAEAYATKRKPALVSKPVRAAVITGAGDYRTLDVVAWFVRHDAYRRPLFGGKHAVVCPWSAEHSNESQPNDTSTVVWETTGANWPEFHCSHAHCDGRRITHVMALWGDADTCCAREYMRATPATTGDLI